jgi:SAM-dependent methyltransferase
VRILEVGAGDGELARALREAGHEVRAIDRDPRADDVEGVERLRLEDLEVDEPFEAVVARSSLHHLADVGAAIGALVRALAPGGQLIVLGFAWDLVDFSTASWMYAESLRLGQVDASRDPVGFYEDWRTARQSLLRWDQLRALLDAVADQELFVWVPYLADAYLDGDDHARQREREQLTEGRLHSGAFRYVGRRSR